MRRALLLLLALPLCGGRLVAEDTPPVAAAVGMQEEAAADAVLRAVRAGDAEALRALAAKDRSKDDPDPWVVADELCDRGEHDAADAFARAAPRPDVEALAAYVAACRGRERDAAARELLAALLRAREAKDWQGVLERTASLPTGPTTVLGLRLLYERALALENDGQLEAGARLLEQAGAGAAALGWIAEACRWYLRAGVRASRVPAPSLALSCFRAWLRVCERRADPASAATALYVQNEIGKACEALGAYAQAEEAYEGVKARLEADGAGDSRHMAIVLDNLGNVRQKCGRYHEAEGDYEAALRLYETLQDDEGRARTLNNLGRLLLRVARYEDANGRFEESHELAEHAGDAAGAAVALGNLGLLQASTGDYANALGTLERALDALGASEHKARRAEVLGNLGIVYQWLGDYDSALSYLGRALKDAEALGDRALQASALNNIGNVHQWREAYPEARQHYDQALALLREVGDRAGAALAQGNVGVVQEAMKDYAGALASYEAARAVLEDIGDETGVARMLANIGEAYQHRHEEGDLDRARDLLEDSVSRAEGLLDLPTKVAALGMLARLELDAGDPSQALRRAEGAVDDVGDSLKRLGDELGGSAREHHAELFAAAAVAALRIGKSRDVFKFLESGRAGAFLDALGKREAVRWREQELPEDLRQAYADAEAEERTARAALDAAEQSGDEEQKVAARRAHEEAVDALRRMVGRMQRAVKQAVLAYGQPKSLARVKEALREDQALVLYGFFRDSHGLDEAWALVLRPGRGGKTERLVPLGRASDLEKACEGLIDVAPATPSSVTRGPPVAAVRREEDDWGAAVERVRASIVRPLALEADVAEIVLSPEGPLSYLPFGALFEQAVALTPSGTIHALLSEQAKDTGERGRDVLALGDPDYAGVTDTARKVYFRGGALKPLPWTRVEAESVGTKLLLGADATEAGLEAALQAQPRWRAVHFACHGLVDVERPMLSSLALTRAGEGEDDGFLTALEILRMQIPADLAVLSACETSRGRLLRGEGIVGLTRAFMAAGAPRVLCSLWPVDDKATQALMAKFYELWNPAEGTGLGAAAALKEAQAFLREQPQWKQAQYWAAWVLWGLPR